MADTIPNKNIRKTIVEIVHDSGAAHIGTALSAVEILNAIFKSVDVAKIKSDDPGRDRVILSKGHGTSALYAVMYHHGLLTDEEVHSYFKNGSLLAAHTSHHVPHVEHSTGALGHGLPVALGMAIGLASKKIPARVFVVTGDGELHEGSNWEAFMMAGQLKRGNLCVIVDNNGLSQYGATAKAIDVEPLAAKFQSFNFAVRELADGHDEGAILAAIAHTKNSEKPVAIICHTVKGKGISFMENENLWHYIPPRGEEYEKAIAELS